MAACLFLSVSAGAQQPEAAPSFEAVFGEEIDVHVVNVEVVVEDRSGERVSGLSAEDFRLIVDGREVDLDYFTEILGNRAVETSGAQAPPAVGGGDYVPTNYVLFVDDDHTLFSFRRPVLRRFASQLDELAARDQVAIVVQSRSQLEILSPFTTDRERTREAIQELDKPWGRFRGQLRSPNLPTRLAAIARSRASGFVRDIGGDLRGASGFAGDIGGGLRSGSSFAGSGPGDLAGASGITQSLNSLASVNDLRLPQMRLSSFSAEAQAEQNLRDLEFSVSAVTSTMRALDPPEGRKAFLLLGGDWPTGNFRRERWGFGVQSDHEVLDAMIDTANLLGYTIYPIDEQAVQPNFGLWQNLRYVARDTGGKAFMAGANLEALRSVARDTANYYWLGFIPAYQRNDRSHDIRVDVLRPDLRVRARRGFLDLSRRAERDMDTLGRLLFPGTHLSPVHELRVNVGRIAKQGVRKMTVPVEVQVPVGMFPMLPYRDKFLLRLELRFATVDRNGQQAVIPMIELELDAHARPPVHALVPYETTLTMRRRPHMLAVTVTDPVTGQAASARFPIAPDMAPTPLAGGAQ